MIAHAPPAPATAPGTLRPTKRARPDALRGTTEKIQTAMGDVFVTINRDPGGDPFEVFAAVGKAGSVLMADVEAICRLASLGLRFGVPIEEIFQQLRGISSDRTCGFGTRKVLSVPDAIAQAIGHYLDARAEALSPPDGQRPHHALDPRQPQFGQHQRRLNLKPRASTADASIECVGVVRCATTLRVDIPLHHITTWN